PRPRINLAQEIVRLVLGPKTEMLSCRSLRPSGSLANKLRLLANGPLVHVALGAARKRPHAGIPTNPPIEIESMGPHLARVSSLPNTAYCCSGYAKRLNPSFRALLERCNKMPI